MAATLFAAPPTASLPEAVQHFLQVIIIMNISLGLIMLFIIPIAIIVISNHRFTTI